MARVIIAGGRNILSFKEVRAAIRDSGFQVSEVVCGMARGVDTIGRQLAKEDNIPVKEFPANWHKHGKAAGHIRNGQMARYADSLILIWDGKSPGSRNMLQQAKNCGLAIYEHMVGNTCLSEDKGVRLEQMSLD